jgi:hypothetical protein
MVSAWWWGPAGFVDRLVLTPADRFPIGGGVDGEMSRGRGHSMVDLRVPPRGWGPVHALWMENDKSDSLCIPNTWQTSKASSSGFSF